MAREAQYPTISPAELFETVEAVAHSGRRRRVWLNDRTIAISVEPPCRKATGAALRGRRRQNGFLAAYGSVQPLDPPRTLSEITEIAAEEAARAGVSPYAGS